MAFDGLVYHYDYPDQPQKPIRVLLSCKHWTSAFPDVEFASCPYKDFRHGRRAIVAHQDGPVRKKERPPVDPDEPPPF